ncbi:hypothetical protein [Streptomyces sp. KL116D]|uniref:hypothetical protein n=1 Tax=Streptomyces sp. KL116D TaxID=3045152 RepID=UPI003557988B
MAVGKKNAGVALTVAVAFAAVGLGVSPASAGVSDGGVRVTGVSGSAATAKAASCYGDHVVYHKDSGDYYLPDTPAFYKTTSRCADINIDSGMSRDVKVCFYKSDYSLNYCQANYTTTTASTWVVVASDVKDGVLFRFRFRTSGYSGGYAAF